MDQFLRNGFNWRPEFGHKLLSLAVNRNPGFQGSGVFQAYPALSGKCLMG